MISDHYLFWLDLEMTGLDPERNTILEIASLVTNNELQVIARGPAYVIHQPESVLDGMEEWVRTTHTKSGLLQEVRTSPVTLTEAYTETLVFLKTYCAQRTAPLCGNSVHQDRLFLRKYMPDIDAFLHYRIIDVSTVKELVRRWYPHDPRSNHKKPETHRALEDIFESLTELRTYREFFFRKT